MSGTGANIGIATHRGLAEYYLQLKHEVKINLLKIDRSIDFEGVGTQTEWGHSRWELLEKCPRAYAYRYVYGVGSNFAKEDVFTKAEAKRLLPHYINYWADREDLIVMDVERPVRVDVGAAPFTMRIDLIAKIEGRITLIDHKTTSKNDGNFGYEHMVNSQFIGSAAAWPYFKAKKSGAITFTPVPVMLNRIIRTKDPKFDRHSFVVEERQVDSWKQDHLLLNSDRKRYEASNYFPKHRSSCQGRFGLCDFYNLCHGGPAGAATFKIRPGTNVSEITK